MRCCLKRLISNISLLIFIFRKCHRVRSLRIKCQNPDAPIKVSLQPPVMCNTWPPAAVCVYAGLTLPSAVWPPAAPLLHYGADAQERHARNSGRSEVILDGVRFCHLGAAAVKTADCKTENREDFYMCSCAIWTYEWVCVFFFPSEVSSQGEVGYGRQEKEPFYVLSNVSL